MVCESVSEWCGVLFIVGEWMELRSLARASGVNTPAREQAMAYLFISLSPANSI